MQANLILSLSDPIEIVCSEKSPLDLYKLIFPEGKPQQKLLKVLENAPPQRGIFTATVWHSDFGIHPGALITMFNDAKIEHKEALVRVRAPTLQEYLEFQKWLFVPKLTGRISEQEELFYYEGDYHEEFDVFSDKGYMSGNYMYPLEGDEICAHFLLILEDF